MYSVICFKTLMLNDYSLQKRIIAMEMISNFQLVNSLIIVIGKNVYIHIWKSSKTDWK